MRIIKISFSLRHSCPSVLTGLYAGFLLTLAGGFPLATCRAATDFRVTPYVQNPATNAMTLIWFAHDNTAGQLRYWQEGGATATVSSAASLITVIDASAWQHQERLTNLKGGTTYHYSVTQGTTTYSNRFKTAPTQDDPIRFVYYNDPETEPGSTGSKTTDWDDPLTGGKRTYFIDQTDGYASNLVTIARRQPDLIVIAGDLAGKGSEQSHWDEFWRHNAGELNDLAGTIPIVAALGNHDYYSYAQPASENAVGKWIAYFDNPTNGVGTAAQQERFYRLDYGPATFIVLDTNNGDDSDLQKDTNYYLTRASGCQAPDFNPGSAQYDWLETQLADAQINSRFTFVVTHQAPFSAGYHGRTNNGADEEFLSGAATRVLTNVLMRYGVDAWLCGHDEMMEHSQVTGQEIGPGGAWTNTYNLHVFDNASAGDGLRGKAMTVNPWETFRAHVDAPEMYDSNNILTNGGKHYGHMEINIAPNNKGEWAATLTPVYVFVTTNTSGQAVGFDRRTYDDEVILTNRLAVTPITQTSIDWLKRYGLAPDETGANFDEGDGQPAWQEFIAGTDPTNLASCFRIDTGTSIPFTNNGMVLSWASIADRLYSVSSTTSLLLPFTPLAVDLPATPPLNVWTDNVSEVSDNRFYRIGVRY